MSECIFCKIGKKEIPAEVVGEDARTLAFLDIHPKAPGHTVIIPKAHCETLIDLPEEEMRPLFAMAKRLDEILVRALRADGMTIGINQGKAAGQAVPHFHLHLMPRFAGDGGSSVHGIVLNPPRETIAEIAAQIRKVAGINQP